MKSKAISYALFGYGKPPQERSFPFETYLRGLTINIMLNRLLFPDWEVVVHTDTPTFNQFGPLLRKMGCVVYEMPEEDLCKAMLWRLRPIFFENNGKAKYTHVICRDTDSPPTYREAQAVQDWIAADTTVHAITDSVGHGIPLLGGMVGFRPEYFTTRIAKSWDELIGMAKLDYKRKGSDQDFMNRVIYPLIAQKGSESITQHYVLGMANTFLAGYKDHIPDVDVEGIDPELRCTNDVCGHIGAAGAYEGALIKVLNKYREQFADLLEIQRNYPKLFYWT